MHSLSAILHADGGSRGNPGPSAGGAVLFDSNREFIADVSDYCGDTTNNVAEYRGLIAGLALAYRNGVTELDVYLDSELIVKQMSGTFNTSPALIGLKKEAENIMQHFSRCTINHITREQNAVADSVVNRCLDHYTRAEKKAKDIERKTKKILKNIENVLKNKNIDEAIVKTLEEVKNEIEYFKNTYGISSDFKKEEIEIQEEIL